MAFYRFFELTNDGHIARPPEVIDCKDDEQAIAQAKKRLDGRDIEIWAIGRFVTKISPAS